MPITPDQLRQRMASSEKKPLLETTGIGDGALQVAQTVLDPTTKYAGIIDMMKSVTRVDAAKQIASSMASLALTMQHANTIYPLPSGHSAEYARTQIAAKTLDQITRQNEYTEQQAGDVKRVLEELREARAETKEARTKAKSWKTLAIALIVTSTASLVVAIVAGIALLLISNLLH